MLAPGLEWMLNPGGVTVFLNVVAALPGDYNFDGIVNLADYTVWRDNLGQIGVGLAADGDLSGVVDEADYLLWRSNCGAANAGVAAARSPVPEPAGLLLVLIAAGAIPTFRRRR